jgi:hypothetical protein
VDRGTAGAGVNRDDAAAYDRCHARPECEAKVAEGCTGRNEHAHHRQLRAHGGKATDVNLLALCLRCHQHVHANPQESYELGLLVPSWADPEEWPVTR